MDLILIFIRLYLSLLPNLVVPCKNLYIFLYGIYMYMVTGFVSSIDQRQTSTIFIYYISVYCVVQFSLLAFSSSCQFRQMWMYLSMMLFFGNVLFIGVSFLVDCITSPIWRHAHYTGHAISRQLSVIFVFHVVSVKYMFSLSTCTCLSTLICFCIYSSQESLVMIT